MKKILFLCFLTLFACSCASLDSRIATLEAKVTKLEKRVVISEAEGAGATQKFYWRNGLEGGGNNLDGLTGMLDGDGAMVAVKSASVTTMYFYIYKDPDSTTESNPTVIQPVSGTGRWLLCGIQSGLLTANAADGYHYIDMSNTDDLVVGERQDGRCWYSKTDNRLECYDGTNIQYWTPTSTE